MADETEYVIKITDEQMEAMGAAAGMTAGAAAGAEVAGALSALQGDRATRTRDWRSTIANKAIATGAGLMDPFRSDVQVLQQASIQAAGLAGAAAGAPVGMEEVGETIGRSIAEVLLAKEVFVEKRARDDVAGALGGLGRAGVPPEVLREIGNAIGPAAGAAAEREAEARRIAMKEVDLGQPVVGTGLDTAKLRGEVGKVIEGAANMGNATAKGAMTAGESK